MSPKYFAMQALRDSAKKLRKDFPPIWKTLSNIENSKWLGIDKTPSKAKARRFSYEESQRLATEIDWVLAMPVDTHDPETGEDTGSRPPMLISLRSIKGVLHVLVFHHSEKHGILVPTLHFELIDGAFEHSPTTPGADVDRSDIHYFTGPLTELLYGYLMCGIGISIPPPSTYKFNKLVPQNKRQLHAVYGFNKQIDKPIDYTELNRKHVLERLMPPEESNVINLQKVHADYELLSDSVYFSGFGDRLSGLTDLPSPDLDYLPFKNFSIGGWVNAFVDNRKDFICIQCSQVAEGIEVTVHHGNTNLVRGKPTQLGITAKLLVRSNYRVEPIYYLPTHYHNGLCVVGSKATRMAIYDYAVMMLRRGLDLIQNFEVEKVSGRFTQVKGKVALEREPRDVHLIVDLSKPRTTPISTGSTGGGWVMAEHTRRGHFRRNRAGVRIWINEVRVNEGRGKELGTVSKEYTFNN